MQQNAQVATKKLNMNTVIMIIIGTAIVAIVAAIAWYIIANLRKNIKESDSPPSLSDHLTTFRDARADGSMTEQEFNRVKAHLSKKMTREVRRTDSQDETGDDVPKFIAK